MTDGTLVEAWASHKSFKPKTAPGPPPDDPGNPAVDFRGERRSKATHASTTDPEARLAKKSPGHAGPTRLSRPRPDGQPPQAGRADALHPGDGPRRAGDRRGDGAGAASPRASDPRGRQAVRHPCLRARAAASRDSATAAPHARPSSEIQAGRLAGPSAPGGRGGDRLRGVGDQ